MLKFLTILFVASQAIAQSCNCTGDTFTNTDITGTINQGKATNPNPTSFSGSYPHRFGNRENLRFPFCTNGSAFVEYPLKRPVYVGSGSPGAHRVVYLLGNNGTFCGCMTHRGAATSTAFVGCT